MGVVETIGIDLGGSKMLVGVIDSERKPLFEREEVSAGLSQDDLLELMATLLVAARKARPEAVAAGVGIPCTIDQRSGKAIMAVNLPLADVPIRDLMSERLGLPVFIDNDANVAALAEQRFGAARGAENVVLLTVGTGIGGGLVLGGEVYRGTIGAGAELGHMTVDADGPPCQGNCPNRGCLETMASGTALVREYQALTGAGKTSGKAVVEAALTGEAIALEAIASLGRWLGIGITSLANVFNPDVVVVGGGIMAAGDLLLDPAREELRARALRPMDETPVVPAAFGPEAGMVGAATLAMAEMAKRG